MSRRDRQRRGLRTNRAWASVVQSLAFVRKELAEILRQPKLLLLLVLGPFSLLLMFGAGYRDEGLGLRTMFVGPRDSVYEDAMVDYRDSLSAFVDVAGYTDDEDAARAALAAEELDVVVVFPPDPLASVLAGESAPIRIVHSKIDPLQTTAVSIAAQLAIQELNATVLTTVVSETQSLLRPVDDLVADLLRGATTLAEQAEEGDPDAITDSAGALATTIDELDRVLAQSGLVVERLGGEPDPSRDDVVARLQRAYRDLQGLSEAEPDEVASRAEAVAGTTEELAAAIPDLTTIDPAVIVRPFSSETETTVAVRIQPVDFFTPSSLALLLQHLALTFAALSLVRDRELGLFELLQVGPLSSIEILTGKTIAYLTVGLGVGAALVAAAVYVLDVPFQGDVAWAAAAVALVLLASLSLGLLISLISGSETQAVQYAMLSLLAGLFFSGFFLDLNGLTYPVKAVSWLLPVTYGIRMLQDIMLRGNDPATVDLVGIGALVVGYGGVAVLLLRRQLRTA